MGHINIHTESYGTIWSYTRYRCGAIDDHSGSYKFQLYVDRILAGDDRDPIGDTDILDIGGHHDVNIESWQAIGVFYQKRPKKPATILDITSNHVYIMRLGYVAMNPPLVWTSSLIIQSISGYCAPLFSTWIG